ncbi:P-loop NTPase [Oceanidesulfovibrio indonesiensis]|uniref:nucleotide-binding protein n=1 Tax=Oceanidesulfovibrio indonesiensis TaxID=54767 RepID=UPI001F31AE87|nr:P-loop NTPase [Oceanidesulfovibrio indonesiensis]
MAERPRPLHIAVASGKGGTGKTTVTTNLATHAARQGRRVIVADCDVEEPNAHISLCDGFESQHTVTIPVPDIDQNACLGDSCGLCVELCRFKALILMAGEVMVFPELCHACGLCEEACPAGAVKRGEREVGAVRRGRIQSNILNNAPGSLTVLDGLMRVGEAMAPPLIHAVKAEAESLADRDDDAVLFVDCPPGASCPTIAGLKDADMALLVAEPTAFGLHDFKLALETVRVLGIPHAVVVNRSGMGDYRVEEYLVGESIPYLASLPMSMEAARAGSRGELLIDAVEELAAGYAELWAELEKTAQEVVACAK